MRGTQALAGAFWGRSLVSVEWRRLCYLAYAVDPAPVSVHLPRGVSLELRDDRAIVTLVLWEACYPSVFGVSLPKHPLSSETALRYLVREGARRGTVTVQEDSSSPFAALAARALFREPMRHTPMSVTVRDEGDELQCEYRLERGNRSHRVTVRARAQPQHPSRDSLAHVLSQRPYGYQRSSRGELLRFDLDHPEWAQHPVLDSQIEVDFAALYGEEWAHLSEQKPFAVVMMEGSEVRASLPE